jgi:cytosine/adenosine deaminase-related metal-dependent hydrolase
MSRPPDTRPAGSSRAPARGIVIENCAIATVAGAEYGTGYILVADDVIVEVGPGTAPTGWVPGAQSAPPGRAAPPDAAPVERIDGSGCLATPGLVNAHHHLYQWATQGMLTSATLFEWLVGLYQTWAAMDAEVVYRAAGAGLGWLAKSGCTTTTDHHYIFPAAPTEGTARRPPSTDAALAAEITAAREVGLRFHPCRGSMDRGRSRGGLPPDEVVEDADAILAATEAAIDAYHDPSFGSMLRIAVAPCSPFSASADLMTRSAQLARRRGVRLHTHIAETLDEDELCREETGRRPLDYLDGLGWLGEDVWLAHGIHLSDGDIERLAATGTGIAHCPSSNARLGAGIARVRDLIGAGAPVGLGVDGAASSELTSLAGELRQALLFQRSVHGPAALTPRQALEIGTLGGARCLGRADELGTLEPGKLADIALWRVDGFRAAIDDPVTALVFGPAPPLARLLVGGRTIVADDRLCTADEAELARAGADAHDRILQRARAAGATEARP